TQETLRYLSSCNLNASSGTVLPGGGPPRRGEDPCRALGQGMAAGVAGGGGDCAAALLVQDGDEELEGAADGEALDQVGWDRLDLDGQGTPVDHHVDAGHVVADQSAGELVGHSRG